MRPTNYISDALCGIFENYDEPLSHCSQARMKTRRIREFGARFPKASEPLRHWSNAVQAAGWKNPAELKSDFGSADFVGDQTVFNVGGNKYRLIAFVHYRRQIVYIKSILTHEEYDEGKWKL